MNKSKKERLERYKKQREMYLKAEEAVLNAQSYSIGSRNVTKADLSEIAKMISFLDNKIDALEGIGGKRRAFRVIPRDI